MDLEDVDEKMSEEVKKLIRNHNNSGEETRVKFEEFIDLINLGCLPFLDKKRELKDMDKWIDESWNFLSVSLDDA